MLQDVSNNLTTVVNWLKFCFSEIVEILALLPQGITYLTSFTQYIPTFAVSLFSGFIVVMVVNKMVSIK